MKLEKEELTKSKASTRKEIIKIRVEINEIEHRKTTCKIKLSVILKINRIDNLLARLAKKTD